MRKYLILSITIAFITLLLSAAFPAGTSANDLRQVPKQVEKVYIFEFKMGKEKKICTITDPRTQCEIGVVCGTNQRRRDDKALNDLLSHGPDFKITVPGQQCATFDVEGISPTNPCHCSGGRCWC